MSGLRSFQRYFNSFPIAHFPNKDYLGGLTQGSAQGYSKTRCIRMKFALVHGRIFVGMQKFYRILDSDDVVRLRLVDQIDDGCQSGTLPASGWTSDENYSILQ